MVTMPDPNPIVERLARLYRQWETFATDPAATSLRWLFRADELRMFEAFLAIEDDEGGELPAMFVVLDAPFRSAGYGDDLKRQLEHYFQGLGEQMRALGHEPWRNPSAARTRSDVGSLMEFCSGSVWQLGDELEQLVLVLWPRSVEDVDAFAAWLTRAIRVVPERVRLVVLDRVEAPQLEALSEAAPSGLRTVTAQLDMGGAIMQISEAVSHTDSPGGRIRREHLAMSHALSRGDTAAACEHASRAEGIARDAGLPHLEVAAPLSLAAGLFAASDIDAALREYGRADQLTEATLSNPGNDWAGGLRLQARLGQAASLVAMGAWEHAAERYVGAASLARDLSDQPAQFEAQRMAAAAYEHAGLPDDAWTHGLAALELATQLDSGSLTRSTARWLGELLFRLSARGTAHEHERRALARRLDHLLGGDWRLND
jgi:tetratricopeptide (TPR) repeat protein